MLIFLYVLLDFHSIGNSCHKLMEFAIIRYRDASMTDPIASENRTTVDGPVLHPSPDRHNFTDSIGFPSLRPLGIKTLSILNSSLVNIVIGRVTLFLPSNSYKN